MRLSRNDDLTGKFICIIKRFSQLKKKMKVSQEPLSLTDILKDKTFTVPLYQREYSWSLDQVSDLFYDIIDTDNGGHFLGSLLLYKDGDTTKMEIVDGQQRVTTLFIFLYALLQNFEGSGKTKAIERIKTLLFVIDPDDLSDDFLGSDPRLETGKRDKKLFKSIVKGEDYSVHKDGRRKSHKNLTNTLDFFNSKLSEIQKDKGYNGIVNLTQQVIKSKFIVMTAEKQSDKLLLFKTINARGMELTQGDLIKNELCHNLNGYDIDEAIESWDEVRAKIEKNNGKLDTFLFHFINSLDKSQTYRQEMDKKRGVEKWNKKNYPPVPEKYVFDIYTSFIKELGPQKFLQNLLKASGNYTEFINPPGNKIYLSSIKAMGVNKCFPLFLNAVQKLNKSNFEKKLCNAIDSLTFRHSILRNDPKELERFYYQLSEEIKNDSTIDNIIAKIKAHSNFKDEEKFKSEFIQASPKSSVAKMILDRISRNHGESVDWTNKDVHIEHIMPQKPAGEWLLLSNKDNDEYKDYLNRLGNLTILQDKKNIRARNKDFNKKKEYYKESRLKITRDIKDYDIWNYDKILERQEYLYNEAENLWK